MTTKLPSPSVLTSRSRRYAGILGINSPCETVVRGGSARDSPARSFRPQRYHPSQTMEERFNVDRQGLLVSLTVRLAFCEDSAHAARLMATTATLRALSADGQYRPSSQSHHRHQVPALHYISYVVQFPCLFPAVPFSHISHIDHHIGSRAPYSIRPASTILTLRSSVLARSPNNAYDFSTSLNHHSCVLLPYPCLSTLS